MSIKNLSERRRLPRIGKLHLGTKLTNKDGVEYPHAEDHFVCPVGDSPGAGLVQAVYGDTPVELDIMFPSNNMDMVARQEYKYYTRTRKIPICRGNGENAFQLTDLDTGAIVDKESVKIEMRKVLCTGQECTYYGKCREVMNLQFLMPNVPGVGVWQLDTGSINSIINVNSDLELIRMLTGTIVGIPLKLKLGQQEAEVEGKRKNIYVLHIIYEGTLHNIMQEGNYRSLRLAAPVEVPEPDEAGDDLHFPKGTPDLADATSIGTVPPGTDLSAAASAPKASSPPAMGSVMSQPPDDFEKTFPKDEHKVAPPPDKKKAAAAPAKKPEVKAQAAQVKDQEWVKLGYISAAEQIEMRTKLYKMTAEDMFAKEEMPAKVAAEWLKQVAAQHEFKFENTSTMTKGEAMVLIQEASELIDIRKAGK